MDLSFYKSLISEEIREEGLAEGRAQARAESILLVLEQRGITVSDEVREQVTNCGNPDISRTWLIRAITTTTAEDIFKDA
ncbi:hypothetical protein [Streptomyces sp. NPDC004726]